MIRIYRILINVIYFISPIIILIRILNKKEDKIRFKEKLCFISKKRPKGKLVWFHASSVGEVLSIIPLIEKYWSYPPCPSKVITLLIAFACHFRKKRILFDGRTPRNHRHLNRTERV